MKLTVLVDNNTLIDEYYGGEPAVSYCIENEGDTILLDVAYSDLFLKNATALNIDMQKISTIVISHGHNDHVGGLQYFPFKEDKSQKLIAHPDAFCKKYINNLEIGSPLSSEMLKKQCQLQLTSEPTIVGKNIVFLGEIPQSNNFEKRKNIGVQEKQGKFVKDLVMDDSALVYQTEKGLYLITGCSHSGICNIAEYAKKICSHDKILGIIGGFHLFEPSEQVSKTIDYLLKNDIKELYPCHCTSFAVKAEIHKKIPLQEVGVGMVINWE